MNNRFHLALRSENKKLGAIPATTSSRDTCPKCPWKKNGCYADLGPLGLHWDKISRGERNAVTLRKHVMQIRKLPPHSLLRLHQAGDFPSAEGKLAQSYTQELLEAANSKGKRFIAYTHWKDWDSLRFFESLDKQLNSPVNVSCDSLEEVDKFFSKCYLDMVTIIPNGEKVQVTPKGVKVVRCPAEYQEHITCATCGNGKPLCARKDRDFVVGFKPHGARKGLVEAGCKG